MCLLISLFCKGTSSHSQGVSGRRIAKQLLFTYHHNEEQISKNNATLGNAGYLPTLDFSAGYTGNLDNIETKARATGEITKNNGVYDQTVNVGLNLNWTIFDLSLIHI